MSHPTTPDAATPDPAPSGLWWQDAVVYQLYPRSYSDATGDGIGDMTGIRLHLDHLRDLGVDAIWLSPCFPSPQRDHGYDVADYFDIEPAYGTLDDFDQMLAAAKERDIKILLDVVPNHCSSEHAWFQAALRAAPGSRERARFWFRDGRGPNGDEPPNNWVSIFGGSAWERVTEADGKPGQWYLHVFDVGQPDFNWYNPDVVEYFDRMLTFWFDRGVEGFRVDAVPVLGKHPDLPDVENVPAGLTPAEAWGYNHYANFYKTGHDVWKHWRTVIEEYERTHPGRHLVTISESYGKAKVILEYLRGDEFHQSFAFDVMLATWRPDALHKAIDDSLRMLAPVGGEPAWTLNNHDTQRVVTRLGRANANDPKAWTGNNLLYREAPIDLELGRRRARAAIALTAALPGALYVYQGEELGLEEHLDMPDHCRQDPLFAGTKGVLIGRDGCRVPLPWTPDPKTNFGFSPGPVRPWLPQPETWGSLSVEAESADPGSMLNFYRLLLHARRELAGPFGWVNVDHPDCLAFQRGRSLIVLNAGASTVELPDELVDGRQLWLSSQPDATANRLPSDTCVWLSAAG